MQEVLKTVKCSNCGTKSQIPADRNAVYCTACGGVYFDEVDADGQEDDDDKTVEFI
jgi:ribosomal protein S27AE